MSNVTQVEPTSPITGRGWLVATAWAIPLELAWFQLVGYYSDVENPSLTGSTNIPLQSIITAEVTLTPRVPQGMVIYLEDLDLTGLPEDYGFKDTALAVAPIEARILSGELSTNDVGDTPGISLLANTPPISNALAAAGVPNGILYWDIQFSSVVYADASQVISPFAIIAPTSSCTISLTDPALVRLPFRGP
jgi:hypothetical protein